MKYNEHKSSIGNFDANMIALGVYLLPILASIFLGSFGLLSWLIPLIVFFIEKDSDFVRFHCAQAFLIQLVSGIISFVFSIIGVIGMGTSMMLGHGMTYMLTGGLIFGGFSLLSGVISIILLVFKIIAMVKANRYEAYEIPIIGRFAKGILNATH